MNLLWDRAIAAGTPFRRRRISAAGCMSERPRPFALAEAALKVMSDEQPTPRASSPSRLTSPSSRCWPAPCSTGFPVCGWQGPGPSRSRALDHPAAHPPRRARARGHLLPADRRLRRAAAAHQAHRRHRRGPAGARRMARMISAHPSPQPGQLLLLMDLIDEWAPAHPDDTAGAGNRRSAAAGRVALPSRSPNSSTRSRPRTSTLAKLPELYGLESARHREAILDFLAIARETYPQRLMRPRRPSARRHGAPPSCGARRQRLEFTRTAKPFIAAGSTGSIPATCTLLKAIAGLPNGAVVLPGLDQMHGRGELDSRSAPPIRSMR